MTKPKVKDIAQRAGVSSATVSNALNGRPGVSTEMADRILTIAKEIGYVQPHARGMEQRSPYARLVMFKSHGQVVMNTLFFAELTEDIQLEFQQAGIELIITHVNAAKDSDYKQRIHEICTEENAGVLLLGTEMSREELMLFSACRSPLVVLDNLFRHEDVHAVVMNNYEAGFKAVTTLWEAGHTQIDHITSSIPFSNARYRRKGYDAAMAQLGLDTGDDHLWYVHPSIEGAYEDMKRYLSEGRKPPQAFFAANDLMAIGSIRALTDAGWRVPEDVSMMGMDDTAVCLACTPTLSTIRVSRRDISRVAVRTLHTIVPDMHQSIIKTEIGVKVVLRDSIRKR